METYVGDIAREILTFLPANSLLRFNCVCKAWNTLIRHPDFAWLHYARSQDRPAATRLLVQFETCPRKGYYGSGTSESAGISLQLDYFCYKREMRILSNQCNGLICLYSHKDTQVYLFNVTTRELKALPPSVNQGIKLTKQYVTLFLGFDQVTRNYKLLSFFCVNGRVMWGEILTLGVTNTSWREISMSKNMAWVYDFSTTLCIFLNGTLYWPRSMSCYMSYFNFTEEKFGILSPPPQGPRINMFSSLQTAIWGKLAIYCDVIYSNDLVPFVYDDVKKVFTASSTTSPEVVVALLGEERISDLTKTAQVIATASLTSVPASLVSSSSCPCQLRFVSSFVKHNDNSKFNDPTPWIGDILPSSFVENIIPLASLLI